MLSARQILISSRASRRSSIIATEQEVIRTGNTLPYKFEETKDVEATRNGF